MIKSKGIILIIVLIFIIGWSITQVGIAAENTDEGEGGKDYVLEIIGTSGDDMLGDYYVKTGLFKIDVSHIEGAHVRISSDDLVITGLVVEWCDNYLIVTNQAKVEQKKMTLTGDKIEYFSKTEKMIATGNLEITTEDAVIYADSMTHLQQEDRTEFIDNVIIQLSDGKIYTERCIMLGEEEQMQFIGSVRGEFQR